MKILKFGGSSVGSPERIRQAIGIIKDSYDENPEIGVVVSAFGGSTDQLIAIGRLAASGRKYLEELEALIARHEEAVRELIPEGLCLEREFAELKGLLQEMREFSPSLLDQLMSFGERLSAKIISEAIRPLIPEARFVDAREWIKADRRFGEAKVDFEASNERIQRELSGFPFVPIITGFIGSTDEGETVTLGRGGSDYTAAIVGAALGVEAIEIWTDVSGMYSADPRKAPQALPIAEMSYEEAMDMARFGAKVLHPPTIAPAYQKKIPIWIKNTFDPKAPGTLISEKECDSPVCGIASIDNVSLISVVGNRNPEAVFNALKKNGVKAVAIVEGGSVLSAVVKKEEEAKAIQAIHDALFPRGINLFIAGAGLIGSALLNQLRRFKGRIRVVGLANSRKMVFRLEGIPIDQWPSLLEAGEKMDRRVFLDEMKRAGSAVFVDCTSSQEIADAYEEILDAGISVVAANKKANSARYEKYRKLHERAEKRGVMFLYGSNAGAGLPLIAALRDQVRCGDRIRKIEAVLSGSLSYILNAVAEGKSGPEAVEEAQKRGYTEPDPREDLSGQDVARKLLILCREAGIPLEMDEISLEPVLPEKLEALENGKRLRYIASFCEGRASVRLQAVGSEHPFYHLSGNDNILSIQSDFYPENPLMIRGPGAGAEVTASRVLNEIIQVERSL